MTSIKKGRALVTTLAEATESLATHNPGAGSVVADTVQEITKLYTNHIWKEDETAAR